MQSCNDERKKSLPVEEKTVEDIPLFSEVPFTESGVDFVNKLRQTLQINILTFKYFYNGGGVALGDVNNDGLTDLYFTGNLGPNRLFLNQGDFKFTDVTRTTGVDGGQGWTNGAVMVDINNDGWLDIYVCRSGNLEPQQRANQLFINNKDGSFTDKAAEYGLDDTGYSTHSTFFDYDLDGDLDMYLLNHNIVFGSEDPYSELKNKKDLNVGDKLYRNDNGKFFDVSEEAGIKQLVIAYGLGVGIGDFNDDNFPDIYVCNDFTERDYLYLNNKNGTFTEKLKSSVSHTSNFSMGVDVADFNNDGLSDILVADMASEDHYRSKTNMSGMNPEKFWKAVDDGFHYQYMVNTLQLNRGDAQFSEIAHYAGIPYTDWSWAPLFADFDNDGWKDIFISNGYRRASRNNDFIKEKEKYFKEIEANPNANVEELIKKMIDLMPEDKLANYVYKNNADLTFSKKSNDWGLSSLSYSNGSAMADLDNDGDLDLVINNIDQASSIYRNNSEKLANSNFLRIQLNGSEQNKRGIGAKVIVKTANNEQTVQLYPSRGYLSSVEDKLHIGLGQDKMIDELKIIWPDQKTQIIRNIEGNKFLTLNHENATTEKSVEHKKPTLFTEITNTSKINFKHKENSFDDFKDEILLPHKMSTLGPCLAVADLNNDGLDDFYIGGAKNQAGAFYIQKNDNTFFKQNITLCQTEMKYEDMGAVFFDLDSDGDQDLYVASGGSEVKDGDPLLRDRIYLNDGKGNFSKGESLSIMLSSSCVKPFDFDADGDLDLFVGGRMVPGKYPFPTKSTLLRNDNGILVDVNSELAPALNEIGMVTSAVWIDVNQDEKMDLILAGEWMPITVLLNRGGKFELSHNHGLENSTGWWFSLEKVDIDNDGDLDLVAGNLGLNYKYKTSELEPFQIYCHDFDSSGTMDIYLGYFQQGSLLPVRGKECSTQQMPYISKKFKTYDAFAKAPLIEILGKGVKDALNYKAKTFATSIIENLGDGTFKVRELPAETQFSSVNGIVLYDINKDSYPDIVLAGNLHGSEVETPRNDASFGTVLMNDTKGNFNCLTLTESGFLANGDVKAMSLVHLSNESVGILIARNNDRLSLLKLNR